MPGLDPSKLVFLDETGAKADLTRTHGYAPRGQRPVAAAPYGRWHTTTFVGALRADGFVAPLAVDGALNGALFRAYVEQQLAPALRPGDVLVLDPVLPQAAGRGAGAEEGPVRAAAAAALQPGPQPDLMGCIALRHTRLPPGITRTA
jgi:hypothetical protein